MADASIESGRYGLAITLLSLGGVLTLTVVGAVLGVPLMLAGSLLVLHTWYKDFDDEPDDGVEPA